MGRPHERGLCRSARRRSTRPDRIRSLGTTWLSSSAQAVVDLASVRRTVSLWTQYFISDTSRRPMRSLSQTPGSKAGHRLVSHASSQLSVLVCSQVKNETGLVDHENGVSALSPVAGIVYILGVLILGYSCRCKNDVELSFGPLPIQCLSNGSWNI